MAEGRGGRPISDIMQTPGDEKFRVLATKGAATFLMLEGGSAEGSPGLPTRENTEGRALAALAEEVYRGLSAGERDAWPGGVALALQMLADRSFFPPVETTAGAGGDGIFRALAENRYVRVVNFHATPARIAGGLEAQLSRLARSFAPATYEDLIRLVDRGDWPHERPGVIVSFFDGYRDNYDVAAPILDRLGLTGWFFVVSGWVSARPEDQPAFAAGHDLALSPYDDLPADDRLALSPGEIRDLADRGHVIASHTRTHSENVADLGREALTREAADSREELERISGARVGALAWYAGMALGANPHADAALRDAGYDLLFANHAVQRIP